MEEKEKEVTEENVKSIELTDLTEGSDVFSSQGFSSVKVTKGGEAQIVRIPIKSTGITELIEEFRKKEPKPPAIPVLVNKDSEEGKAMKLTANQWMKMPDFTEPKYMAKKEQYEGDLGIAILSRGIALPFKDKEGNLIEDQSARVQVLKDLGLSSDQFAQIVEDIRSLTQWSESELLNFFGVSSV